MINTDPDHPKFQHNLVHFVTETQITTQLDHPNMVPIHEINMTAHKTTYFTIKRVRKHKLHTMFNSIHTHKNN